MKKYFFLAGLCYVIFSVVVLAESGRDFGGASFPPECPYCPAAEGPALPTTLPTGPCRAFSANTTCYNVFAALPNGEITPEVTTGSKGRCRRGSPFAVYPGQEAVVIGTNLSQTTQVFFGSRSVPFQVRNIPTPPTSREPFSRQGLFFRVPDNTPMGVHSVVLRNGNRVRPLFENGCNFDELNVLERIRLDSISPLSARVGERIVLRGTGATGAAGFRPSTPSFFTGLGSNAFIEIFFGVSPEDPVGQLAQRLDVISNNEVRVTVPWGAKPGKIKIRAGCVESISSQIFNPLAPVAPAHLQTLKNSAQVGDWVALRGEGLTCPDVAPFSVEGSENFGIFFYSRGRGQKCFDQPTREERYPTSFIRAYSSALGSIRSNPNGFPRASRRTYPGSKIFFTGRNGWIEGNLDYNVTARLIRRDFVDSGLSDQQTLEVKVPPGAISGPIRLVTPCGDSGPSQNSLTITPTPEPTLTSASFYPTCNPKQAVCFNLARKTPQKLRDLMNKRVGDRVRIYVGRAGELTASKVEKVFFNGVEASFFEDGTLESPSACLFGRAPVAPPAVTGGFSSSFTECIPNIVAQIPLGAASGPITLVDKGGRRIQVKERLNIQSVSPALATCGDSISCYDHQDAKRLGKAKLPDGTEISLVQGADFFQVWKETHGPKILPASGLMADGWQKKLNPDGRTFTDDDFTDFRLLSARVCLKHAYNPGDNGTKNPKCIYHTKESVEPITFWEPNQTPGTEGQDFFGEWQESSWYHGNIAACSQKGMRLPILLEIGGNQTSSGVFEVGLPQEPIALEAFTNFMAGGIQSKKHVLTASVFDPPTKAPLFGTLCSQDQLIESVNPLGNTYHYCQKAGQLPSTIHFPEPFATSSLARTMYWIAVPARLDLCGASPCQAFPNFYFPIRHAQLVKPVHVLCVLPSPGNTEPSRFLSEPPRFF